MRDGGPGWHFEGEDKSAIQIRVNLLLDLFRRKRRFAFPALFNSTQTELQGGRGEGLAPIFALENL